MKSAEQWAKRCHERTSAALPEQTMCLLCAGAYARERMEALEKAVTAYRDNFTAQTLVSRDGTKDVASVPRVVHDQLLTALRGEESG